MTRVVDLMKEFITEKAIVRIHPGKLSEEERKEVITHAAQHFITVCERNSINADNNCVHRQFGSPSMGNTGLLGA